MDLRSAPTPSAEELLGSGNLNDFQCLIVDQDMPRMTGLELVAALRAQGVKVPALLISGHLDAGGYAPSVGCRYSRRREAISGKRVDRIHSCRRRHEAELSKVQVMQLERHQSHCCVCSILAICATSAHAQRSPEDRGEDLMSQHCAMCHAIGRSGTSPDSKAPPLRELTQRGLFDSLELSLEKGQLSGHPQMPAFSFRQQDVSAILRYLQVNPGPLSGAFCRTPRSLDLRQLSPRSSRLGFARCKT